MQNQMIIAGPCAVESLEQMLEVSATLKKLSISYIRACIFKPRTSPHSFQGIGIDGVDIIRQLKHSYPELKIVTEVLSIKQLELVAPMVDIIQIGARNMQNFEFLKMMGDYCKDKKVLLKRGFANTLHEWLSSAEYLIESGVKKENIILCERGSRSYTSPTGVSIDFICALAAKKEGFQVIIDPSHGTKDSQWVTELATAAMSMNLDGIIIEAHPKPSESKSDAMQALSLIELDRWHRSL